VKKGCLEDLLNVPLSQDFGRLLNFSLPHLTQVNIKSTFQKVLPEMKPESCEFTGRAS
ncbi:unnamed protein product, partial [Ranitomeya imitator]